MKMISVPRPSSGVRCTAASMLPASLRAGMTTEQRYCGSGGGCGRGRATMNEVRQNQLNTGANQRFSSVPSSGVRAGQRMRGSVLMTSQPASCSRLTMSAVASQFCGGLGDFSPSAWAAASTGRQRLLKKLTTSRVFAWLAPRSRASTACTSSKSFTKSERRR